MAHQPISTQDKEPKKRLAQIILRIDDEYGHHIIRAHDVGWSYTIEGYTMKPENYLAAPAYYLPITTDEVAAEFAKQGKEFRKPTWTLT